MTRLWALWRVIGVLTARAVEPVRSRRPLALGEVPGSPQQITAEWLTGILCSQTPGAHVMSVRVTGTSVGTTTRAALELTYDQAGAEAGLPTQLFVKCTSGVAQRLMLGLGGLIEGEPGFYAEVRPGLAIEAPEGYFAAVDSRTWRSIVVIEDVAGTRGASFWRPGTAITRSRMAELLSTAATWHGALWGSPRLIGWRWLKTPADQMRVIDTLIRLADRRGVGSERAAEVIPARLRNRQDELYEALGRAMRQASQGPPTYLHGDLHIANTYVTREGRMGICDWQVGLRGSWAHDVGYLLATALGIEDRRAWERELLEHYLDCLAAAGGPRIPADQAWLAYRRAPLYPYFAWIYTIGRARWQPAFQPHQVGLMMLERIAAAIEDLDSLGAVGV